MNSARRRELSAKIYELRYRRDSLYNHIYSLQLRLSTAKKGRREELRAQLREKEQEYRRVKEELSRLYAELMEILKEGG